MAYSDPGDLASGAVITETWVDKVRANDLASAVAAVAAEGDIVIGTAATALAALTIGTADSTLVAGAARPEWQIQPAARV